jgi:hypothetical protein
MEWMSIPFTSMLTLLLVDREKKIHDLVSFFFLFFFILFLWKGSWPCFILQKAAYLAAYKPLLSSHLNLCFLVNQLCNQSHLIYTHVFVDISICALLYALIFLGMFISFVVQQRYKWHSSWLVIFFSFLYYCLLGEFHWLSYLGLWSLNANLQTNYK